MAVRLGEPATGPVLGVARVLRIVPFPWVALAAASVASLMVPSAAADEAEAPETEPAQAYIADASAAGRVLVGHPRDRVAKLMDERIVLFRTANGEFDAYVQALVLFAQPRDRVVRLMVQTERQIEYRGELAAIETVERFEGGTLDEHRIRFMFRNVAYRLRTYFDFDQYTMRWELDPAFDNGLHRLEGFWRFYVFDADHTLGHFGSVVDVGALPQFFQSFAATRQIPATMDRVRRWVDSGGRWRP